jgi:hypothetical protein
MAHEERLIRQLLQDSDEGVAEHFEVADPAGATRVTVMVLDPSGRLRPRSEVYDRRVAGVVAGAGSFRPGVLFEHDPSNGPSRASSSVIGKVCVGAHTSEGPIGPETSPPRPARSASNGHGGPALTADDRLGWPRRSFPRTALDGRGHRCSVRAL